MKRVLIVEDDEMNRDMLRRRLQRRGFEVIVSVDGSEAFAAVLKEKPDVIVMDMGLPDIDGWALTEKIRADSRINDVPILALTAHALPGDREKTLQAGCDDYDTKPVDIDRVVGKINKLCEI